MDSVQAFTGLLDELGMNPRQAAAFTEFGCNTLSDLAGLTSDDIDKTISVIHKTYSTAAARERVRFNVVMKIKLKAITMHFKDRVRCYDALLTAAQVGEIDADVINDLVADFREQEDSAKGENIDDLPTVEIGKLTRKTWRSFNIAITETLSRTIGSNHLPLTYVIRDTDRNDFDADYSSRKERLHDCVRLSGQAYRRDRDIVFSLLLQKTKDSEGFSIVEEYQMTRDGRSAYKALLGHFEDGTYRDRMSQEGTYTLRNAVYAGVRKNFTFGRYYQMHSEAHVQLSEAGLPMSAEQKINDFITGITCPIAQSIIVSLAGNRMIRTSFESYYNELSSRLSLALRLSKGKNPQMETRNVNSLKGKNTTDNKRKSQETKSNNNSNDSNSNKKSKVDEFVPEDKIYDRPTWGKLTHEQRKSVVDLRRNNRRKRFGFNPNYRNATRNFSQAHGQYFNPNIPPGMPPRPPYGPGSIQQLNAGYQSYYGGHPNSNNSYTSRSIENMSNIPYSQNVIPDSNSTQVSALSAHTSEVGRAFGGGSNPYQGN